MPLLQRYNDPCPTPPPPTRQPHFPTYPSPHDANHDENSWNEVPAPPPYTNTFHPPGMDFSVPPPGPPPQAPPPLTKPKRKQVKMECTNCAAAAKRCDGGCPCERCQKYGIGDLCKRKERKKGIKRGPYKRNNKNGDVDWQTNADALTKDEPQGAHVLAKDKHEEAIILEKDEDKDILTKHVTHHDLLSDPNLYKAYLCRVFGIQVSDVIDLTGHINRDRFIAAGGSGEVWKASWIGLSKSYSPFISTPKALPILAVKLVRLPPLRDDVHREKRFKMMKRELLVWSKLNHSHIHPLIGIARIEGDANLPAFISPWMENGNVMEFLKHNPSFPASRFLKDIIKGLHYLHTLIPVIVHGDIKGANILINHRKEACLSDFGLSRLEVDNTLWRTAATHANGTLRWMAPELIEGDVIVPTIATDIYAFGMTCYEILSRGSPFGAVNDFVVMRKVTDGQRPAKIKSCHSDEIWSIITRCWAHEPEARPSTEETLRLILQAAA